jgi:hypothetical protein
MYPYAALRCPTYRENSHANHTWHPPSRQIACFEGSEEMPVWVRFPSPAPLFVVWRVPVLSWDAAKLITQFPQSRRGYYRSFDRVDRSLGRVRFSMASYVRHRPCADSRHRQQSGTHSGQLSPNF